MFQSKACQTYGLLLMWGANREVKTQATPSKGVHFINFSLKRINPKLIMFWPQKQEVQCKTYLYVLKDEISEANYQNIFAKFHKSLKEADWIVEVLFTPNAITNSASTMSPFSNFCSV